MNIDNIHDALNLLDDDMIEAVDKLRNEKTQIIKMHRKNTWIRWVSIAACICLVLVSVYVTNGFGLMSYKGASNDMAKEETLSGTSTMENESVNDDDSIKEVGGVEQNEAEEDGTDVTDEMSGGSENKNELIETPSVLVEIVSWGENGFTGTVTGIVDTEKYPVGTTVTVKFNDDIHIKVSTENGTTCKEYIPDSTDFPVGSIVCVQFDKQETVEHSSNGTDNNMSKEEYVLYAETITLSDSD